MEQENFNGQTEDQKPKNKNPFHALIPKGNYFFTPIILNINILIFVLMIISGVHPMLPSPDALIKWGANYHKLTMGGEPWRLFTSMFLHFGIIHLAVNMFALYSLGSVLEPFIGKTRFLLLYIFAGLGGSAVSLWWHAYGLSVSAGASGAIFGIFGVFAAILTTDLIDQSVRKQLLKSIGSAIVLNLLIGLYGGIDNSAHIGGLLTGAAGGYLCYFDLRDWYRHRIQKYRGVIFTGILTAGMVVFFWMITPTPIDKETMLKRNDLLMHRYDALHEKALTFWDQKDSATTLAEFQTNYTQPLEESLAIFDSVNSNGFNDEFKAQVPALRKYVEWRIAAGKFYERALKENRPDLKDSAKVMMDIADTTITTVRRELNMIEK